MKKQKKIILVAIFIVILTVGYLMKKYRTGYNYGDTYYIVDYFTVSKLVSLLFAFLIIIFLTLKKLTSRKNV